MSISRDSLSSLLRDAFASERPLTVRYRAGSGEHEAETVTRFFYIASDVLISKAGAPYVRTVECYGSGPMAGEIMREDATDKETGETVSVPKARTLRLGRITTAAPLA